MVQAVTQVNYEGKQITIMDYSGCEKSEVLRRVDEVKSWISKQPLNSLLTITDVSGQIFDKETISAFKGLAAHNKPYVKAGTVVGIEGLMKIAYNTVMAFSGRNMPIFESREKAMVWLSNQP